MQGRLDGTRFAVLVFTNLSHEHLDFHGTMEDYFAAKRQLFAQAERAVVNIGNDWGKRLAAELPEAVAFDASTDRLDAELALRGRFNVENALGAAAAARALGVDEETIVRGIESVHGVPGRFEEVDEGIWTVTFATVILGRFDERQHRIHPIAAVSAGRSASSAGSAPALKNGKTNV